MRITKKSTIAARTLMLCAAQKHRLVTKKEVAKVYNISTNHLAQVINQLAQLGFLKTHRGRTGGISLARPADQISIGDIFRALEGDALGQSCFVDLENSCPLRSMCRIRGALNNAVRAFFDNLDGVTLESMVRDNHCLIEFYDNVHCPQNG